MISKKDYYLHKNDTGSTAVQIISLREEINKGKLHLIKNKKDVPAKNSLKKKIAKEKRFFQHLKGNKSNIYEKLKKEIN